MNRPDLATYTFYRCLIGSRAYGLAREGSDTDTRGVYLPPAELHWSLAGVPEQLEDQATDTVFWEVEKFLRLALKGNPTLLETLWSPLPVQMTSLGEALLDIRQTFLSRRLYETYRGYAHAQFKRLEASRTEPDGYNGKQAMHTLRLLISGTSALKTGKVLVNVGAWRDDLLAVRDVRQSWGHVLAWRAELERELDSAMAQTRLPYEPDARPADAFLRRARRVALDHL